MPMYIAGSPLPTLPEVALASYPNAVIISYSTTDGGDPLEFLAAMASKEIIKTNAAIGDVVTDAISCNSNGYILYTYTLGESSDWELVEEVTDGQLLLGIGDLSAYDGGFQTVVWSNHNILDISTNLIYFPACVDYYENYAVRRSALTGIARQIRRLSTTTSGLTIEEMEATLRSAKPILLKPYAEGVDF